MKLFLFFLSIFFTFLSYSQTKYTLSGYITDAKNGEVLVGTKIFIPSINQGTVSNNYGFYSLSVPSGTYQVEFRSGIFPTVTKSLDLSKNLVYNIEIAADAVQDLNEVVVNGKKGENTNSTKMGQVELEMDKIKTLPAFMGEVDVIKIIQLLPGVSSVSEGGQGFYVRGGGPDQNLVLLDEAVVYNAAHLFGFFSVFNSDAVKSVTLTKGGMPANFGGRLSSVLEVSMNEGNNKQFKVTGGIGAISSRLTVEGPIVKNKGSFIISGRRTYIDVLAKALIPDTSPFAGSGYFFYDFNVKMNYTLSKNDRIFLSAYYGKDVFSFANKDSDFGVEMPWGNGIAALRWNHLFSSKLFMNLTATATDYKFQFISNQDQFRFGLTSGVRDIGSKLDFSYFPNTKHKIKFGVNYIFHTFTPSSVSAESDSVVFNTGTPQKLFSHEEALYFLDEFDVNEALKFNVGLRYSMYQQVGPFTRYIDGGIASPDTTINYSPGSLIKNYQGFEPRLSMRWMLPDKSSIKAGYAYNYQYVHLTSLSAVSLPTDIWFPSTDKAKPQTGWQGSVGYFKNFDDDKWETSVEIYYKGMNNLIEYKEGALPGDNINDNTDNLLVYGKGWAYGIEFFVKRTVGKFTGWIGYTWSKTERKFPDLNEGNIFPAKYDRRHDLSIVGTYTLNDRWTFSSAFIYATGNTLTLPTSWYVQEQNLLLNYGARNSTRMAPYHRLDISATWYDKAFKIKTDAITGQEIKVKKRFRQNWAFSIYNVYNRANPFFLFVDQDGELLEGDFKLAVKQVSLFPIIPSVTWNFEF